MIYVAYFTSFTLMIVMAIVIMWWVARTFRPGWPLAAIGATTFILSQVGHIPFNLVVINVLGWVPTDTSVTRNLIIFAVFAGLSAGLFEEVARYLTYRFWATKARTWSKGLMLGSGHGGIEAILIGTLAIVQIGTLIAIQAGALEGVVPPEDMGLVQEQIDATFNVAWYVPFLGAAERFFAIMLHLSLSLMVMQVFTRRQWWWLPAAILWHGAVNAAAVIALVTWGAVTAELILAVLTVVSFGIILGLRQEEPEEPEPEPLPTPLTADELGLVETADMVEESRYS